MSPRRPPPPKEPTVTDGNALFAQAILTCARGRVPRDGGAALMALTDWLTECIPSCGHAVALADPLSGIGLVVFHRPLLEYPFRCHFIGEDNDDDGTHLGNAYTFATLDGAIDESSATFPNVFRGAISELWQGREPT